MRLESCKRFDTEMFIKNQRQWKSEKERLLAELESLSELPSVNNTSGVRGTNVSDPTSRLALRRIEIQDEIKDIERCEALYDSAKKTLTKEEMEIFKVFFEPKEPIWKGIDKYTQSNYTCRMNMYRARRKILEKLTLYIADRYDAW